MNFQYAHILLLESGFSTGLFTLRCSTRMRLWRIDVARIQISIQMFHSFVSFAGDGWLQTNDSSVHR